MQTDFRDRVRQSGVKYGNLFDYINTKASEGNLGNVTSVTETEFREALNTLENDSVVNLIGHASAPTIRFIE